MHSHSCDKSPQRGSRLQGMNNVAFQWDAALRTCLAFTWNAWVCINRAVGCPWPALGCPRHPQTAGVALKVNRSGSRW